eukprot:14504438-Alexandrium_andersonii.AAC.1
MSALTRFAPQTGTEAEATADAGPRQQQPARCTRAREGLMAAHREADRAQRSQHEGAVRTQPPG